MIQLTLCTTSKQSGLASEFNCIIHSNNDLLGRHFTWPSKPLGANFCLYHLYWYKKCNLYLFLHRGFALTNLQRSERWEMPLHRIITRVKCSSLRMHVHTLMGSQMECKRVKTKYRTGSSCTTPYSLAEDWYSSYRDGARSSRNPTNEPIDHHEHKHFFILPSCAEGYDQRNARVNDNVQPHWLDIWCILRHLALSVAKHLPTTLHALGNW